MRRTLWVWIFGLGALAACNPSPESEAHAVCTALCACTEPSLPVLQGQCIAECASNLAASNDPAPGCIDCVFEHANECATMIAECDPVCSAQTNPPDAEVVNK